jgi:hypothetical protein
MPILVNENMGPVLELLENVIKRTRDPVTKRRASILRDTLSQRPMAEIINAVPGSTITAQAALCKVSRQTFYNWMNGAVPNTRQAQRLTKITGYTIAEIRGRG